MTATLLLGKPIAESLQAQTRQRAQSFADSAGRPASLAIVRVGEDPDAAVYTRSLLRACRATGLRGQDVQLPAALAEAGALDHLRRLGDDPSIDAILVQTPLPAGIRREPLIDAIPPVKDVDGLTAENAGLLARGVPRHVPATASALLLLAEASGVPLAGARAVVVGRSNVVGLPAALLLLKAQATVTVCHRATTDLATETRRAQVLVVAAGRPGLITGDMLSPGVVVLDAGTTMTEQGLRGDVDAGSASEVARALTPVPGGVGPVTTAVLLAGVVTAADERRQRKG